MHRLIVALITGVVFICSSAHQASAVIAFKKEFQKLYINPDTNEEFSKLVKSNKTGCLVCHQGKKRKHHNSYGIHLTELLDKKKDVKDKEKIIAALKKVEKMHVDPDDKKSPTYGELIKANKLPGGPLETVKKEPEQGEEDKPETEKAD
jgi:hypothetical protein